SASSLTSIIDTGTDLQDFSGSSDFTGTGVGIDAKIDLHLVASINMDDTFPSMSADLLIHWGFNTTNGLSGDAPTVEIKDLTLNLGEFISKVAGPILTQIDKYLGPVKPLLDMLNTDIPVISQLSELLGQGEVRFIDAIKLLGEGGDTVDTFITILTRIVDFAH